MVQNDEEMHHEFCLEKWENSSFFETKLTKYLNSVLPFSIKHGE